MRWVGELNDICYQCFWLRSERLRVNAVCPGVIETPMNEEYRNDAKDKTFLNSMQPVGRIGRAEEVASTVLYICSPNAGFATGTELSVDGGIAI